MHDIEYYEKMMKLRLTVEERATMPSYIEAFKEQFGELDKIDTEGVEPLVTVLDIYNVLRDDVAEKLISREELLKNAPEQYDGYFQVPKTVD